MTETPNPPTLPGATIKGTEDAVEDPRKGLPDNVNVVEADAPMKLDATKKKDPKGQYIQYNGVGTVRIMGPEEWAAAHVDSDQYFEWNYLNHKQIPRSAFSDEQLQYLLRVDDRFSLVNLDSDGKVVVEDKEDK